MEREGDSRIDDSPGRGFGGARAAGLAVAVLGSAAALAMAAWAAKRWWPGDKAAGLVDSARDVSMVLVGAMLLGRVLLRAAPPLLEADGQARPGSASVSDAERTRSWARWFIHMRWLALLVSSTLTLLVVRYAGLLSASVWVPLWWSTGLLAAINLGYWLALRAGFATASLLRVQVYADLLALTALVHFSGGIENPLYLLSLVHVIIGGIVLTRAECYTVAGVASGLFALLAGAEWLGLLRHYPLEIFPHPAGNLASPATSALFVSASITMQTTILFLVAYFVTTLVDRIRSHESRMVELTEEALNEHRLLEQALETTGTGLRVVDRRLRPQWVNAIWKSWFATREQDGPPAAERGGSSSAAGAAAPLRGQLRQSLEDGSTFIRDHVMKVAGGRDGGESSDRVVQVTTAPLRDDGGNIVQVAELARDVTEQRRTQELVTRAGKMAAIGELAANVAHEVNNPVGILGAKARLLLSQRSGEMSPKVRAELEKIVALSDRVARIAEGLLSYSRPAPGVRSPLDILVPIRKAIGLILERVQAAGVKLDQRLGGGLPAVKANANEMEQVFLNLFLNALDEMPDGGTLIVAAQRDPNPLTGGGPCLTVAVEDSGAGVSEADAERIFEPFFTSKSEGAGTGLGLSICLGIVRSHGGEIGVRRSDAGGARFEVRLPLAGPVPAAEPAT